VGTPPRPIRPVLPGSASSGPESVWDYPRPPRVEPSSEHVVILLAGRVLADTRRSLRVLETSHPPVYYVPVADIDMARVRKGDGTSWCEFKGTAVYWDGDGEEAVGWSYPEPSPGFEVLRGHVAFYPARVDEATVDGERVKPQDGSFYGGWITSRVTGPFKGGPGTRGW
jgi:uncharacterized protein (DUF427 family)